MKPLDHNYLSLQFKNKIHSKNGNEFQSFFEGIMGKAYSDFRKIRPYGNMGDGGNDGYRKNAGIYYQVNAPQTPKINEAEAAKKLHDDFQKLKNEWDEISNIKEYNFVFNDKYGGSVQLLEEAITNLKTNNPEIEFKLFLANDLEDVFFQLSPEAILDLSFNIDQRQAISNAYTYLESVKIELDREYAVFAQKLLNNMKEIILALDDEKLSLEQEILECRCLQKFERIDEAKEKYESISKRYPDDPLPLLYLAEIHLNDKDFDKNLELLERVEKVDSNNWLLKLELVVRKLYLGEKIDFSNIDEKNFPGNPKLKGDFYRLYSLLLDNSGDLANAARFVEKAIHLNSDRLSNHIVELDLLESQLLLSEEIPQRLQISQELLAKTKKIEAKFAEYGDIGARNKASLNMKKLRAFLVQDNIPEFENVSKETFELVLTCYFDLRIEHMLVGILRFVSLPDNELNRLLEYLKNSRKKISDELANMVIAQFNLRDTLLTDGKKFFEEIRNQKYLEFIFDLENRNYEKILQFFSGDYYFAIAIANTLKSYPELRKKIIENLPDEKNIQKEKLLLLFSYDEKDYDDAFQILKQLDLSELSYAEGWPLLHIAQKKQAWDFEVILLEKLLEKEKSEREVFNLQAQLFNAYLNLKKYLDVINLGERLLNQGIAKNLLLPGNKEELLSNIILSCIQRGKVDTQAFKNAKDLLQKYPSATQSYEFKVGVEAELYLQSAEPENALKAVIEGVKIKKLFTPQEYAKLHFLLVLIGNQIDLTLVSLPKVQANTFVKLSNKHQWYFVGYDNELDALLISEGNNKFASFIDKHLGDKVIFENKFSSQKYEGEIEKIYSIEKYILWQSVNNFQDLAKDDVLEGVQLIEVPQKEDSVDLQNLFNVFEDINTRTKPLFDMYCQNNVPLAMLAVNEGSLTNAIGRIQQENRGFINFSSGTTDEFQKQVEVARKVINEKTPFFIDGTSAMFLSELGIVPKIYTQLPQLKVSQSVINLLADIADKFKYTPGHAGYMGFAQGKISVSNIEKEKSNLIRNNFIKSIKLLESNPRNISVISSANKADCFSEIKIFAELSDACILAQKENLPVLTEDFLYLKMNEVETKKNAPEYFSSLALLKVFYEKGYISFDEYLDFFGYFSSYRFRFLSINQDDIEMAVFGQRGIKNGKPENIRKLNFPLTLSVEYGVPVEVAFRVVGMFLFRVIIDNGVPVDIVEKTFFEITETFPTTMSKKELGQKLLAACKNLFESSTSKNMCKLEDKPKYIKFDKLNQVIEFSTLGPKLLSSSPLE